MENKPKKKKKAYIKTKTKLDGGKEVIMTESPSKTLVGKIFAVAIAILTILVPVLGLIWILVQY